MNPITPLKQMQTSLQSKIGEYEYRNKAITEGIPNMKITLNTVPSLNTLKDEYKTNRLKIEIWKDMLSDIKYLIKLHNLEDDEQ